MEDHGLRVFENRVMKIFGPKRGKVTLDWGRLHGEDHRLYSSPNTSQVIKSKGMRWAGRIARMGQGAYRVLGGEA
jgi:hypothetical protein